MYIAFGILIIIIAVLLILIVIIQNPKGGMMSSSIGSMGNQILGASKSTDAVEKFTWYLAGALMVMSVGSIFLHPDPKEVIESETASEGSQIKDVLERNKNSTPVLPSAPIAPPQQNAQPSGQPAAVPENTPPAAGK